MKVSYPNTSASNLAYLARISGWVAAGLILALLTTGLFAQHHLQTLARRLALSHLSDTVAAVALAMERTAPTDSAELSSAWLAEHIPLPGLAIVDDSGAVVACTSGSPFKVGDVLSGWIGPRDWFHSGAAVVKSPSGRQFFAAATPVGGRRYSLVLAKPLSRAAMPATFWPFLALVALAATIALAILHHRTRAVARSHLRLEQWVASVADGMAAALAINPSDTTILAANTQFCQLSSREPSLVEGRKLDEVFAPWSAARLAALVQQACTAGVATAAEIPLNFAGGAQAIADIAARLVHADPPFVLLTIVDVSERAYLRRELAAKVRQVQQQNETLRQQLDQAKATAARYRALLTHALDGVLVVDAETLDVVEANPRALEMLGRAYDDIVGRSALELDASGGMALADALDAARKSGASRQSIPIRVPGQREVRLFDAAVSYVDPGDGPLFQLILRDVTEQNKLQRELEAAKAEAEAHARRLEEANHRLQELAQAKSYFLSTLGHELRAPLNSIIGFAELLLDESFGPLTDRQRDFLEDIHRSGEHLLRLLNDVLDLARMEAGRLELHREPVSVRQLFAGARTLMRGMAFEKRQTLEFEIEGEEELFVLADEYRAKQILVNLISNAIKYSPEASRISIRAWPTGDFVTFAVADQGPGIPPEDHERIFKEFERAHASVFPYREGAGLGLPLAKQLVEAHGGRIWLESQVGAGSVFYFTLPRIRPPVEEIEGAIEAAQQPEEQPETPEAQPDQPDAQSRHQAEQQGQPPAQQPPESGQS